MPAALYEFDKDKYERLHTLESGWVLATMELSKVQGKLRELECHKGLIEMENSELKEGVSLPSVAAKDK